MKNVLKVREKFVEAFNNNEVKSNEELKTLLCNYTQNKIAKSSLIKIDCDTKTEKNISVLSDLYIQYLKTTKLFSELAITLKSEDVALITLVQNSEKNNFYI